MKILFVAKREDTNAKMASEFLKQIYSDTVVVLGKRNTPIPQVMTRWEGDYIFSYLSPWIIPITLLERAKKGGINWHPGPPEYPGIGCTNFAIYNKEEVFGITCHYMEKKVDTGSIIEVRRFAILEDDTVYSVTQKSYALILASFYAFVEKLVNDKPITTCGEHWARKPYTRKELDALCLIEPDMELEEVENRIRSTTYDKPWAYTEINGKKFYWKE